MVAHDGFTLKDLYSCNGTNNNQPWPFGPSDGVCHAGRGSEPMDAGKRCRVIGRDVVGTRGPEVRRLIPGGGSHERTRL